MRPQSITGYSWARRTKTQQLAAELSRKKRNKFNAVKTVVDGIAFDSKREANHYGLLRSLERAGHISRLRVHPKFYLAVNDQEIATYRPDFTYWDAVSKRHCVIDVKSAPTARKRDFVLIKKLMKAIHGIEVEVVA